MIRRGRALMYNAEQGTEMLLLSMPYHAMLTKLPLCLHRDILMPATLTLSSLRPISMAMVANSDLSPHWLSRETRGGQVDRFTGF